MEVREAIRNRRSNRNFKSKAVSKEKIDLILEAGRLAPSGVNIQPWRFVVVESNEMRKKLKKYTLDFVAEAPVVIVCCVDRTSIQDRKQRMLELQKAGAFAGTSLEEIDYSSGGREMDEAEIKTYLHLNCAIAIENMVLQATGLGLGSCWIKMMNQKKISQLLDLSNDLEIVSLLPIGYPKKDPEQRPRLSLEEIVIDRI